MSSNPISQAQTFWNKSETEGWSDEQTRSQMRREAGVVHNGFDFIFSDGSALRDDLGFVGRKLVVREST